MAKSEYVVSEHKARGTPLRNGPEHTQRIARGKAKNFGKSMSQLIAYSKGSFPWMIIAVILAIAGTIFNIVGPGMLSKMTDLISDGMFTKIDVNAVVSIAILLATLYAIGFLFNLVQGIIMADVSQKLSKRLRSDISNKINRLPLKFFDNNSHGDILSRVTNDVDTIGQSLTQSLSTFISSVTMLVGTLIMMFWTNWIMTLAGVAATIVGFTLMTVIISQSQSYFTKQQTELGKLNGHIEEMYTGHSVVKAYNGEKAAKKTFDKMNRTLYNNAWKSQFLSGLMMPLMGFVGNFGYVVVCIAGAMLVLKGSITFGVIVAFMLYIRLFTQPLSQLAQVTTSMQSAAAASERVFNFLHEEELSDESKNQLYLKNVEGNIDFDKVTFGYDRDKIIIKNFSARAQTSQKIAIVGPTGAGKTTLVNLLMKFYELNDGDIRIDGTSIKDLTRENVHELFSMVLQDTWLFEGTIKENIIYSKEGVSDEQVIETCKAVGLHHFITTLPRGYETVLDDNANLSSGQKQLITIARSMIKDAPMLILDEATSSVDTRTEALVQKAMDTLMIGRTSFIIAHRLSTIRNADLILVMKDGDVIESGNHDMLMKQNGFYTDLYNSQFEQVS